MRFVGHTFILSELIKPDVESAHRKAQEDLNRAQITTRLVIPKT